MVLLYCWLGDYLFFVFTYHAFYFQGGDSPDHPLQVMVPPAW